MALAIPGFLVFLVVGTWVGLRLLFVWRRTRGVPELLIAIGILGIGSLGLGASTIGSLLAETGLPGQAPFWFAGLLGSSLGAGSQYLFSWLVYRPESRYARAGALAGLLALGLCLVAGIALYQGAGAAETLATALPRSALLATCLLWAGVEALVYWRMMCRRMALGLADPVLCNRFLLWGVAACSASLGSWIGVVGQLVLGNEIQTHPGLLLCSSMHGLVAAIAMWLAFVPPAWYVARVEAAEVEAF